LTAADLMSEEVLLIPQEMTLRAAARLLAANRIHGAPVVDSQNRCVGVLSTMDLLRWASKNDVRPAPPETCFCQPWQIVEPEDMPADIVRNYMTTDPVLIGPETPIAEVARKMIDAHIHRLIVVHNNGHPRGIVTCTDILAAVAYTEPPHPFPSFPGGEGQGVRGYDSEEELALPRCPHAIG
jgi:predicted transcriptional regulator